MLLHDGGALLDEQRFTWISFANAIGRMPRLRASDDVHEIIRIRPVREFRRADAAGVFGEQEIADLELVVARIHANRFVQIQHTRRVCRGGMAGCLKSDRIESARVQQTPQKDLRQGDFDG